MAVASGNVLGTGRFKPVLICPGRSTCRPGRPQAARYSAVRFANQLARSIKCQCITGGARIESAGVTPQDTRHVYTLGARPDGGTVNPGQ